MARNLYLTESRARRRYTCDGCSVSIPVGSRYFRDDPLNLNSRRKKIPTGHWCLDCIGTSGANLDVASGRYRVSVVQVLANQGPRAQLNLPYFEPARVQIVGVGSRLSPLLQADPALVHKLTPKQFQDFLCERIEAMGFEPQQVGNINRKDGGIDILFWPRRGASVPFLGAIQAKHHADISKKEGPAAVRDFAGAVAGNPINVGLFVTNTTFTADARWFANNKAPLLQLKDFMDIRQWLIGNFGAADEWRGLPESIEVCPGIIVPVGGRRGD
jgi:hypothetical protein